MSTQCQKKEDLIEKLIRKPIPKNFTMQELDFLMKKCGCQKRQGGRGSGIAFFHAKSGRILQFDAPHPGKELYDYQMKKTIVFLKEIGEIESFF